ncbi:hypothetical protein [uncultured Oscillibacter sp.]|uniref:hypothetical protein n=1 Tax=uncultured Oscillibacter sp. TaxID=876091 RepID=UPI00260DEF6C|nr:hypothetical protein [uncultured Oscillibacter sp.]
MGLLSFLKKPERKPGSVCPQPREQEAFLFQIEDVFAMRDGSAVAAGQMVQGRLHRGSSVLCVPVQGQPFSCTVDAIEQPDPKSWGEFIHPDAAWADGPWNGHYSLHIPGRGKADFHPGDRLEAPGAEA